MRPGYQAELQSDGRQHTPAYLKARAQLEQDSPIPMLKRFIRDSIFTQRLFWFWGISSLIFDAAITTVIILSVKYTEIDYSTYMQQAAIFMEGERDYSKITGSTGRCVYPALHLYLYSFLHWLTEGGKILKNAQAFFALIYLATQFFVMKIYKSAGAPSGLFPFILLSKRLHSLYVLRLFNDPLAMCLFYFGVWMLCKKNWRVGCVFYSLALGVKMNILLFAPALAVILFRAGGISRLIVGGFQILSVQLLLALPFSSTSSNFTSYLSGAFDLSRIFLYKWSVNWRMISEETFLSKSFSTTLLVGHLSVLLLFGLTRWTGLSKRGCNWLRERWADPQHHKAKVGDAPITVREPSGKYISVTLFTSNLIGMAFSRSLHYQFFSWYSQQIPLLVWSSRKRSREDSIFSFWDVVFSFFCLETSWNTYPSTDASSTLLLIAHFSWLIYIWFGNSGDSELDEKEVGERQVEWERGLEGKEREG